MSCDVATSRLEFSVYQFFPDDSYERVLSLVDDATAVQMAMRLTLSVGAKIGTTRRVMITDGGDECVFLWVYGKGVVFPTAEERAAHKSAKTG